MSLYTWGLQEDKNLYKESRLKRIFDIILSSIGIILSFPLWIIISILIYLEAGRPIFFIQERVGKNGKIFRAFKFRSMLKNVEAKTLDLADKDIPREMITKIGRILRDTAMDELPQLINILKGDISFVGPRPFPIKMVKAQSKEISDYSIRHFIRPGLTGLAQVYGRDDITPKQKLRFDLFYIKKRNFLLDLKLILLSFYISLKGKWKNR